MSIFNKYNSSKANTKIPINTTAYKSLQTYTYSTSSYTSYGCQLYTDNNATLYSVNASYFGSGKSVLLKAVAPSSNDYASNNDRHGYSLKQTGSGISYYSFSPKPTYCWRENGYIYLQFDDITPLNINGEMYLVMTYNSSSSGNYRYYNYRSLKIVSAIQAPSWSQISLKIYDNGEAHIIPKTIERADSYKYDGYSEESNLQDTIWQVTPNNTYTLRVNRAKTKLRLWGGAVSTPLKLGGNSGYGESQLTTPTPTTDPDTGEYIYTITIPSGMTSLRLSNRTDVSGTTNSMKSSLYGQRTAGWYDIDDRYLTDSAYITGEHWVGTNNTTLRYV